MSHPARQEISAETIQELQTERSYARQALYNRVVSSQRELRRIELSQFAAEVRLTYPQVAFVELSVIDSWGAVIIQSEMKVLDSQQVIIRDKDRVIYYGIRDILDMYDPAVFLGSSGQLLPIDELAMRRGSEFIEEF